MRYEPPIFRRRRRKLAGLVDGVGVEPTKALGRQIYSLLPLTTWVPIQNKMLKVSISEVPTSYGFLLFHSRASQVPGGGLPALLGI